MVSTKSKRTPVSSSERRHSSRIVPCWRRARSRVLSAGWPGDPRRALRAVVHAGVDAHRINAPLHKVLTEQVPRVGRIRVAMDTSKVLTERLAAFLAQHEHLLNGRDAHVAAFVVETVVEALTHRAVLERHDALATGVIEREALELVTGYLFGAVPDQDEVSPC